MNRSKLLGSEKLVKSDMTIRAYTLKKFVFCLILSLCVNLYQHMRLLHYKGVTTQQNKELVVQDRRDKANHDVHKFMVNSANQSINDLLKYIEMQEIEHRLSGTISLKK